MSARIIKALHALCLNQGCIFNYSTEIRSIIPSVVETVMGDIYEAPNVAVCTNGEGYFEKFGMKRLSVKTLHFDCSKEELPDQFTDLMEGYYVCRDGDNLEGYKISSLE